MNWMILTKMLRGVSLGTTLREPLGKSAEMILRSRLEQENKEQLLFHFNNKYCKESYVACDQLILKLTFVLQYYFHT